MAEKIPVTGGAAVDHRSVSFVITVYNKERFLPAVLRSVCGQTGNFEREIVIVNDGSTDGSLALIRAFATEQRNVRVIDQPNQGCSGAMNAGVAAARNDWIKPVDADDLLAPDATERLLEQARATDCRLIFGRGGLYELSALENIAVPAVGPATALRLPDPMMAALRSSTLNPTSMLIAADLYRAVGGCDPALRWLQDYSLLVKSACREPIAVLDAVVFLAPRAAEGRVSDNKGAMFRDMNTVLLDFVRENPGLGSRYRRYALRRVAGRAYLYARRHGTHGFAWLFGLLKLLGHAPISRDLTLWAMAKCRSAYGAAASQGARRPRSA
jgi:glycosyltransferase involved in cell wall biosynthesis